jgi:hypothetical protein
VEIEKSACQGECKVSAYCRKELMKDEKKRCLVEKYIGGEENLENERWAAAGHKEMSSIMADQ